MAKNWFYNCRFIIRIGKRKTKLIWHNELSSHPSFDWIKKQIKVDLLKFIFFIYTRNILFLYYQKIAK